MNEQMNGSPQARAKANALSSRRSQPSTQSQSKELAAALRTVELYRRLTSLQVRDVNDDDDEDEEMEVGGPTFECSLERNGECCR